MQLTPAYGTDPILRIDGPPATIAEPTIRQRRRLASTVAAFTDEQWMHPSRCEGWSNRDVIAHLDTTNSFWSFSIAMGLKGKPSEFLSTFDPVASPAALVAGTVDQPTEAIRDSFLASNDAFLAALEALGDDDWSALAETPVGHVTVSALAHHAIWDSWIHERDILLPLGLTQTIEPDEVAATLRYVAALGAGYHLTQGASGVSGALGIEATDPDLAFTVEVTDHVDISSTTGNADLTLTGDAVDLADALSLRTPLDQEIPAEHAWLLAGLATVFDAEPL